MEKTIYYIGQNNETKQLSDTDTIKSVLNDHFEGYTIHFGIGLWHGQSEQTTIVTIYSDKPAYMVNLIAAQLCRELGQDCIGVEHDNIFYTIDKEGK